MVVRRWPNRCDRLNSPGQRINGFWTAAVERPVAGMVPQNQNSTYPPVVEVAVDRAIFTGYGNIGRVNEEFQLSHSDERRSL